MINQTNKHESASVWLEQMLQKKVESNPSFSLRSFAKVLETSPSTISRIISGERNLSFKLAVKIAERLALDPVEQKELYSLVVKSNNKITKKIESLNEDDSSMKLSLDAFASISEWHHYGITQLINCDDFVEDNKWISSMLGVSELEVKLAISRLCRLGILDRDESGNLFRTAVSLFSSDGTVSPGLRKFHKQILEKAILSLDNDPIDERNISSVTVAINEEQLPLVVEEIQKFRIKMSKLLTKGKKTRIYNLGINLFPVSKRIGENNEL